jgi:hypothetical protein
MDPLLAVVGDTPEERFSHQHPFLAGEVAAFSTICREM